MESPVAQLRLPGTVKLIDAQGLLNVKHGHGSHEIILVPQPTDDPDDPLRWAKHRKMASIICAMAWCFFIGTMISGLSPAYILIEEHTGISVADLSTGNGIMYLFMGWGTMITQSLALKHGRRPILVGCIILVTAVTVWTAYVHSRGEYFVNRILLGIFASPQETLIEMVIGDMFFTHDRGFYMGAYSWALFSGALLSPVASGYVAQDLGWQWIQYILAIIGAAVTLLTFFLFEETMFFRDHLATRTETFEGIPKSFESAAVDDVERTGDSKPSPNFHKPPSPPSLEASGSPSSEHTRPYAKKLKLWGYQHPQQPNPFKVFFLPIQLLFTFPAFFFSGLLVGGTLAWYNAMSGSMALILGDAPYNFSTNTIGLTYLACFVGVTIGCCISGWMSDLVAIRLARGNDGIMEPEQRLWICLVALVVHPAGCLLYGVGASYGIHWGGIVVGLGLIAMTFPLGSCLAYTYVLDSYREMAGEGLVSVILVRNMMGFAFGYAVVPMINTLSVRYAFVLIAVLGELLWLTGMAMIYFGKPFRRATARKYWNLVERHGAKEH
ncbi:major facilitator superfamily domain-containing protein [Aspergillus pseudoustus]|uniref:Major facilitator superfamily domain-containing protein n=1 Tax=Aspergillus pseudoustus TaxID=1810923 RepID=A0ABR4IEH7_9EURO